MAFAAAREGRAGLALPLVLAPVAWRLQVDFLTLPAGPAWNLLLFRTVKMELAFGLAICAGAIAQRALG